jgi:predicted site-specific integrase-resolvase
MKYGYARVSTDGQSVNAQVAALRKHGVGKVFREVASGGKSNRARLCSTGRLRNIVLNISVEQKRPADFP